MFSNEEMLIVGLIIATAVIVVMTVFFLIRAAMERRRAHMEKRINGHDSADQILLKEIQPEGTPEGLTGKMDQGFSRMIERTGLGLNAEQALGIICLSGLGLAMALLLWRGEIWLVMLGLIVGIAIPLGIFFYMQSKWKLQLQESLPDAYFFISRSLRAGLNLEQSLALVGDQGPQPLAGQLRRCAEQISLGLSVPAALDLTAKRINLLDFDIFVSVITLHRQTGGNLPLLLDRLAASTRDRNQYRGYFRSVTALGRLTAFFIGMGAPALFLIYSIFYPDYVGRFFQSIEGVIALSIAVVLEIIGIIWLYLLLKIDY